MYITWLGQSCFKIQGKETTLVTDPYGLKHGLKLPKITAEIVTVSHDHDDHNNAKAVLGQPFIISGPGEYEIKSVFIQGILSYHDKKEGKERGLNTIYLIELEGISIAHLGDLGHLLADKDLEKLEGVDILMIPVGGTYTLNAKEASETISQIEPRIIIPMHYKIPGLKLPIDSLNKFCQEMGVAQSAIQDRLRISLKELPQEETKVVLLKR